MINARGKFLAAKIAPDLSGAALDAGTPSTLPRAGCRHIEHLF